MLNFKYTKIPYPLSHKLILIIKYFNILRHIVYERRQKIYTISIPPHKKLRKKCNIKIKYYNILIILRQKNNYS